MRVLVLGCDGNAGMNYARSMHMGGDVELYGTGFNVDHLIDAEQSGLYEKTFKMPLVTTDLQKLNKINQIIRDYKIDFVHPQPDPEVAWLANNQGLLELTATNTSLSSYVASITQNKMMSQMIWAVEFDFVKPVDGTLFVKRKQSREDMFEPTGKVWIRHKHGAGSKFGMPASNEDSALAWINYLVQEKSIETKDLMVFPYLPGREFAVQIFAWDGYIVQAQARERLEYAFGAQMPSGQSSSPSIAQVVTDDFVYEAAYHAIKSIQNFPHGIYCVDMKEFEDGVVIPTEINYGRYFTTSNFFANLGVNTPWDELQIHMRGYVKENENKINSLKGGIKWIRQMDKLPTLMV